MRLRKGIVQNGVVEIVDGGPAIAEGAETKIFARGSNQTLEEYAHEIAKELRGQGDAVTDEEILAEIKGSLDK